MNSTDKIIIFDGVCIFCNYWVDFIIKRDKNKIFRFAPVQSFAGKKFLEKFSEDAGKTDSVFLIEDNRCFIKSASVLRIAKNLGGLWQILYVLRFIPPFIRDLIYDFVANNRYKLFGRLRHCRIPGGDEKERFFT